jgi:hypothetical protein
MRAKTDGPALLFRRRRGVILVYRTGAGRVQEYFSRSRLGAALQRAEFIERVENTPVYLTYPHSSRLVRCVS